MRPKLRPDFKETTPNPFLVSCEITLKKNTIQTNTNISVKNLNNDKMIAKSLSIATPFDMDKQPFIKLFNSAKSRKRFMKLTPRGTQLLLFIMCSMEPGKDWVWLNKSTFLKETDSCLNTYKKAINDLIEKDIIAETFYADTYWINPMLIFCGNRLKKYPNNIIEE